MEALVELFLEEVQEGNKQGRMPLSLRAEYCPDIGSLLDKASYLVCGRVHGCVSEEDMVEHSQGLELFLICLPACDGLHPLLLHQDSGV